MTNGGDQDQGGTCHLRPCIRYGGGGGTGCRSQLLSEGGGVGFGVV